MPRRRGENGEERISGRDLEVLGFVARFGVVPRSAVAIWAGTGRSVSFDRERRLREAQLIEARPAIGRSPVLIATRRGLRLCGRDELRPARLSPWSVRHATVVAHVAASLEAAGERVLSEREIAAAERLEGERIYSAQGYGERRYHRPDLVVAGEQPEAIEVELTNKAPARLDAILRMWQESLLLGSALARVIYLCPPRTLRYVERSLSRVWMEDSDLIVAQLLTLPKVQLPRPTRQPSGGLGAAVKGRRPDPLRGLTAAPPPLPSRVGRGGGGA